MACQPKLLTVWTSTGGGGEGILRIFLLSQDQGFPLHVRPNILLEDSCAQDIKGYLGPSFN